MQAGRLHYAKAAGRRISNVAPPASLFDGVIEPP